MSLIRYQRLASELLPLANKFYKSQRSPMRVGRSEEVWVAQQVDIIAACCLKPVADGNWLTALLVAREQRQQGIASQLLSELRAHSQGRPGCSVRRSCWAFIDAKALPLAMTYPPNSLSACCATNANSPCWPWRHRSSVDNAPAACRAARGQRLHLL